MQRDGLLIGAAWLGVAGFCVFVWAAWSLIVTATTLSLKWFQQIF